MLGGGSLVMFLFGQFIPGFLGCGMAGVGLYAVTPESIQTGSGNLLSSVVVVSMIQGTVQTLNFFDILSVKTRSYILVACLKGLFFMQPLCTFSVLYCGYQLLKD